MKSSLHKPLNHFKLAVFDMDSTLINIECIDELADVAGKKSQVAAITAAAMRGELTDFSASLRQRVALLKGLPGSALQQVYEERLCLNPGAQTLVAALLAAGLHTMLVSGGFTYFAHRVQSRLGLHEAHANVLELDAQGSLTGQVLGAIVDGQAKKQHLLRVCAQLGCPPAQAIAIGDGANDLPMMSVAGLSVAYRAKPAVREQAMVSIDTGGLEQLLAVF
jgi:phosphoserine phosphatase